MVSLPYFTSSSLSKFHPLTDLDFDLPPVVVDGDSLDGSRAVRGGAVRAEVVLVCSCDTLRLEPPPAGGVVGDGTILHALEQDVTFVV